MPHKNAPRLHKLLPLLPLMLLVGCATTSPISSVDCPAPPLMPAAAMPQPSEPYSLRAQRNMERWREMLKATPPTP